MAKFEITVSKTVSIIVDAPTEDAASEFAESYVDEIGNGEYHVDFGSWSLDGIENAPSGIAVDVHLDEDGSPLP